MQFIASTAFGLEGQTAKDLKRLDVSNVQPMQVGGVMFEADGAGAFAANLHLRCADRVLLVMGRFEAKSFDQLFESVKALPWEDFLPQNAVFPVRAHCARSQLMSPSDCQSIVKKAVVERMKRACRLDWFPEDGAVYAIDVSVHQDMATISLDTSGTSLSRRGYRTWNGEAPLRETLAAALLLMSPWRPSLPLYDPCCGTGTFLIEAAMIAQSRAPGLTRDFAMEQWDFMPKEKMRLIREEAQEKYQEGSRRPLCIAGSDLDAEAVELANRHIRQAGMTDRIRLVRRDMRDVTLPPPAGVIIANPPYGERLGDRRQAQAVERALFQLKQRSPGWTLCAISADMGFERTAGRRADKKRRLYNGRLECEFLTFS